MVTLLAMALPGNSSFSPAETALLRRWLTVVNTQNLSYHHLHLTEDLALRNQVQPLILRYITSAHEDAVAYFRNSFSKSQDPRNLTHRAAALDKYPRFCEELTVKGFFGEILAGLVAELYGPHGMQWVVPAFCFRFHQNVFTELKRAFDQSRPVKRAVGRLGDDCVAFHLDNNDAVDRVLACEAKCTGDHDSDLITDAHKKSSIDSIRILEINRITEVISERGTTDAKRWVEAIDEFRDSLRFNDSARYDLISYTYSQKPVRKGTWLDTRSPHPDYTSTKPLAAAEIFIDDVTTYIADIYKAAYP